MSYPGDRIKASPIYFPNDGEPSKLDKIPLTEKSLQEDWLQRVIHDHPSLLPTTEIEPAFSPLISLGREIEADSWFIDNLFISPQGYLTIVETKLWRNPEARREVVGQIIEYAKVVSTWSFNELNQKVKEHNEQRWGVIDMIRTVVPIPEEDEGILIDAISKNMQRGHFLLLIVGDGIRESTEELAEYLSESPQLHFTLALVELKIYQATDGLLVIPQVVTRTREITRAIIRIEGNQIQQISVDTDVNIEPDKVKHKRTALSEEEFFELLQERAGSEEVEFARQLMEDAEDLGCLIKMRQSSYTIRYRDPSGSRQKLSLLIVHSYGTFETGNLPIKLKNIGLPEDISYDYYQQLGNSLQGCEYKGKERYWKMKPAIESLDDILAALESVVASIEDAAQKKLEH